MSPKGWLSRMERCIKALGYVGIRLHIAGQVLFPASKDGMTELVKEKGPEISKTSWSGTMGRRGKTSSTLRYYLNALMTKI